MQQPLDLKQVDQEITSLIQAVSDEVNATDKEVAANRLSSLKQILHNTLHANQRSQVSISHTQSSKGYQQIRQYSIQEEHRIKSFLIRIGATINNLAKQDDTLTPPKEDTASKQTCLELSPTTQETIRLFDRQRFANNRQLPKPAFGLPTNRTLSSVTEKIKAGLSTG